MNRYITLLLAMIGSLLIGSCMDSYLGIEQIKTGSDIPEKVIVNEVIPKPGALEINFTLPKGNPNNAQVVATYTNKQGKKVEFKVSRYTSTILVEGFTGTEEVSVELVSVDESGNRSDVTVVKATPLISPVELALSTMIVQPAFGGIKVEWQNPDAQPFAIHVLTEDALQVGVVSMVEDPSKTIYSKDATKTFAYVRQYPSVEQKFGFVMSDKWGNRTDTVLVSLTPFKEEEIDYKKIKAVNFFNPTVFAGNRDYGTYGVNTATGIQNDGNTHGTAYVPQTLFDGVKTGSQFFVYKFIKNLADPDPSKRETVHDAYVTYDLNMDIVLSRFLMFPRTSASYIYAGLSPKRWRIWGTNDANTQRWTKFPETWTLIGEYVGPDPANLASLTPEETLWFKENQEYSGSEDNVNPAAQPTTPFRYMRIQFMETYNQAAGLSYVFNEVQMFGEVVHSY